MLFSRKIIEKILPQFTKKTDLQFIDAVASTGNELPNKDIFFHPKLNNLTVGKIISFEPIPNTHLNYCTVQIDKKGKTKKIICGAPNVTKDKLVIVANENAVLHDGRIIANREIKGILSEGMLCGYNELTPLNSSFISKYDSEGILLIEEGEIEIGSDSSKIADFLGLNDTIYDIEVPFSNRHDIEGLLCFLQDIAGFFKIKYSFPTSSFKKISNQKSSTSSIKFDKKACNGYCLIKIDNISVKESN
jgi:phenylalanyl-tRNA synthetase beta chain